VKYLHPDIKSFRDDMKTNATIKIVTYGHSWTYEAAVALDKLWASLLKTHIESRNPNATLINSGTPGVETPLAITNLNEKVLSLNPNYCILCWGINDWGRSDNEYYDVSTYTNNVQNMINQIKAIGCKVIMWTDGPVPSSTESYGFVGAVEDESTYGTNKFIDYHNAEISIAKNNGIYLIDSYQQFVDYWSKGVAISSWYHDNLHFGQTGHSLIYRTMAKHLFFLHSKSKRRF